MNMGYREIFDKSPELVELCERGRLLDGFYSGSTSRSWVIHGGSEALIACSGSCDVNYAFWPELLELEYSKFEFNSPHWLPGKIDQLLVDPLRRRTNHEKLAIEIPIIWDAVQQDIWFCMVSRNSKNPGHLFNLIEEAYLASGWPCGWKGSFPGGQLVVFSRGDQAQS